MSYFWVTISYVGGIVLVLLVDWIGVLGGMLLLLLPQRKVTAIPGRFVLDGFSACLSVYLIALVDRCTFFRASILMVLIPAALLILNDYRRVKQVQRGESKVRVMLSLRGEEHAYDQRHDLLDKRAALSGHLSGFATGVMAWLSAAPFL